MFKNKQATCENVCRRSKILVSIFVTMKFPENGKIHKWVSLFSSRVVFDQKKNETRQIHRWNIKEREYIWKAGLDRHKSNKTFAFVEILPGNIIFFGFVDRKHASVSFFHIRFASGASTLDWWRGKFQSMLSTARSPTPWGNNCYFCLRGESFTDCVVARSVRCIRTYTSRDERVR